MHTIPQIIFILITWIAISNSSHSKDNAVGHLIFKRYSNCNTGCSRSCSSCSPGSCSSTCNNCIASNCCENCCQNQCHVCQTTNCHKQSSCRQCCQTHCIIPCNNTTTTEETTTETETSTESMTTSPRPTPAKTSENRSQTIRESMATNTNTNIRNYISSNNFIHVPINITKVNTLRITSRSHHESKPTTSLTPHQPRPRPTTDTPNIPTKSPNSQIIIIQQPNHSIQPVVNLPCYSGSSCRQTRPYWSGQVCNSRGGWGGGFGGWNGYGGYGLNWGHFGDMGCRSIQQDCSYCGSDFYNQFSHGSEQFSSCYGCFV